MNNFTHWNEEGRPKMVDISAKEITTRTAIARSTIILSDAVYEAIQQGGIKKVIRRKLRKLLGLWVLKTADIIPMCHPIMLQGTDFQFDYEKQKMAMSSIFKPLLNVVEKRVLKWKPSLLCRSLH